MELKVTQRNPKEASEDAKGDLWRAKVGPRGSRCAPKEARVAQESAKGDQRGPKGSTMASKMGQDSPKRRPGRPKSYEKTLQGAKRETLILAVFFHSK